MKSEISRLCEESETESDWQTQRFAIVIGCNVSRDNKLYCTELVLEGKRAEQDH